MLLQERRYQDAAQTFERAAAVLPNSFEVYINWGIALIQSGKAFYEPEQRRQRFQAAAEKFAKAAELRPQEKAAYMTWSETLLLLADLPVDSGRRLPRILEAVEKCRKATEVAPDDWDAYNKWGVILASRLTGFAQNDAARRAIYHEAAELFGKAAQRVELASDVGPVFANWGEALVQEARLTADSVRKQALLHTALEKLEKSAIAQPRAASTFALWGSALIDLGKVSHARSDFRTAVEELNTSLALNPDDPGVLYRLVVAYTFLGNPTLALENLKRCFELDGTGNYRRGASRDPDLKKLRESADFKEMIRQKKSNE